MISRVLFVRRSSPNPENDEQFMTETSIVEELLESFDIDSSFDLSHKHEGIVYAALANKKFRAMVTHIPPAKGLMARPRESWETRSEYIHRCYGESLNILQTIKAIGSNLPIIGYSSAANDAETQDIFIARGPLNEIVSKSHPEKWMQDYQKIKTALGKYLG